MPQTPLTNQTFIGSTRTGAQFSPSVSALAGGGYVIVWLDDERGAIFGQRYDGTGSAVGTEFQISANGAFPLFGSVGALAGGGYVVAWQQGSFNSADIHAQRYASDGTKLGGEFTVNSNLPNEQLDVRVVGLDNGGFLIAWDNIAADRYQDVSGRLFNSLGEPSGADFTLNTNLVDSQGIVSVAALPGGGFVATWQSVVPADSGHSVVIGQLFGLNGAKLGGEFQVNVDTSHSPAGNDVAALSGGGFVVSWADNLPGNTGGRIVARHYDASGHAIGGEILIASKASGVYASTAVTALLGGGYLVSWADRNQPDNNAVHARAMGADDVPLDAAFDVSTPSIFGAVLTADGAVTLADGHVVFTWDGPSTNTSEDVYYRLFEIGAAANPPGTGGPGPDTLTGTDGPDLLSGLGELELDVRIVRLKRREPRVRRNCRGGLGGCLLVQEREVVRRPRADRVVERIRQGRLTRFRRQRGEGRTRRPERGSDLRLLELLLVLARPSQMEAGELAIGVRRPRLEGDRLVEGVDCACGVALGLERRRQVAPGLRILRPAGRLLLRVGDGLAGARAALVAEDVADSRAAGADAEDDEPEPEDEREEHEHPLRVAAKPREEHGVLDRRRRRGARPRRYGSMRLRALRAALLESGHSLVPRR